MVPDDGRITYYNENRDGYVWSKGSVNTTYLAGFQAVKDSMSYIPHMMHFHYHMTVEEDLLQLAQIRRIPNPRKKMVVLLAKWGLSAYRNTEINELPVGLLKRYIIAQSLLCRPRIWILDEPTDGLDELGRKLLFQELIHSEQERLTLIATKDMQLAECADNLMLMEWGTCRRLGRKKFLTAGVPEGTVAAWYRAMQAFSESSYPLGQSKGILDKVKARP
jgi:ABC-type multidrug transport system ATPase subunit